MSAIDHSSTKPDSNDSEKILHERLAAARARSLGEYGADYYGDGGLGTGQTWGALQAITATTFESLVGNITGLAVATLPAGSVVYGRWTAFEVSTGKLIAYRAL